MTDYKQVLADFDESLAPDTIVKSFELHQDMLGMDVTVMGPPIPGMWRVSFELPRTKAQGKFVRAVTTFSLRFNDRSKG